MVNLRSALVLRPLVGGDLGPQLRTTSSAVADGAVAPPGTVVPTRVAVTVVPAGSVDPAPVGATDISHSCVRGDCDAQLGVDYSQGLTRSNTDHSCDQISQCGGA